MGGVQQNFNNKEKEIITYKWQNISLSQVAKW